MKKSTNMLTITILMLFLGFIACNKPTSDSTPDPKAFVAGNIACEANFKEIEPTLKRCYIFSAKTDPTIANRICGNKKAKQSSFCASEGLVSRCRVKTELYDMMIHNYSQRISKEEFDRQCVEVSGGVIN